MVEDDVVEVKVAARCLNGAGVVECDLLDVAVATDGVAGTVFDDGEVGTRADDALRGIVEFEYAVAEEACGVCGVAVDIKGACGGSGLEGDESAVDDIAVEAYAAGVVAECDVFSE